MKSCALLIIILSVFILSSTVYADQYGAPEPTTQPGKLAVSLGYSYYDSKWESGRFQDDINVAQTRLFLQANYSFIKNWEGYVRGGAADFRSKSFWSDSIGESRGDFRDGFQPYATVGFKGIFCSNDLFAVGPFVQGTYQFAEYKSSVFLNAANSAEYKFKNPWDVTTGIAAQAKWEGLIIYGGPFVYWAGAEVKAQGIDGGTSFSRSTNPKEKGNFGGFLGIKAPVTKAISFNVEAQIKSQALLGVSLNYNF